MVNLEKIIKVTQEQYNILASGGKVGDYVGLQDEYIYIVEDENTYLPTTGGTITGDLTIGGNTTFKQDSTYASDKGISFIHNNSSQYYTDVAINHNFFADEIIYNATDFYKPLFANDNQLIIFSEDSNYSQSISINTRVFYINDFYREGATNNYFGINLDGEVYFYEKTTSSEYTYTLPKQSGTLALISDIPEIQILITTGNEIDNNFSAFRTKLNSGKPIRLTDFWLHDGAIHFAGSIFYPPISAPSNTLIGIFVSGIHQYRYTIDNNNEIILELLLPQVKRYI